MAKIRIYELARELNMTNRMLLEKLGEAGISVKSHMSSLEEETAEKIKGRLLGRAKQDVEITRVKPTVIRRRRKQVSDIPLDLSLIHI